MITISCRSLCFLNGYNNDRYTTAYIVMFFHVFERNIFGLKVIQTYILERISLMV